MERSLKRLLSTSSYRELTKLEKAIKLKEEEECSYRVAAKLCSVNKSKIESAIKAKKAGRILGKVGRPRALTSVQEESLTRKLQEKIYQGKNPTFKEFRVCYFVFFLY